MTSPVTIGRATLYLGDCRDILPTLPKVDAVVTDPPYGVAYASQFSGKFKGASIEGDMDVAARDEALSIAQFERALVFGSWKSPKPQSTKQTLIWDKGDHVGMGNLSIPWSPNTEEIYVIGSGFKGHRGSAIIRCNAPSPNFTPNSERFHPMEKPVVLMQLLIDKTPGAILDPFMGSGTTGVAAVQMGRNFIGIEIDPWFFAAACKRIEDAQRQGDFFVEAAA